MLILRLIAMKFQIRLFELSGPHLCSGMQQFSNSNRDSNTNYWPVFGKFCESFENDFYCKLLRKPNKTIMISIFAQTEVAQ